MRAPAGLHRPDPAGLQSLVPREELAVLAREDVVGHGADVSTLLGEVPAELQHQRRLASPHGSADADGEGALVVVAAFLPRAPSFEVPGRRDGIVRVRLEPVVGVEHAPIGSAVVDDPVFALAVLDERRGVAARVAVGVAVRVRIAAVAVAVTVGAVGAVAVLLAATHGGEGSSVVARFDQRRIARSVANLTLTLTHQRVPAPWCRRSPRDKRRSSRPVAWERGGVVVAHAR